MQGVTGYVMLGAVGLILLRGAWKGKDAYAAFLRGAERGMRSALSLLPALCAMLLMLALFRSSGAAEAVMGIASPILKLLRLPEETAPLILLRPLTGSGSIAAMEEIFSACGVDSRAGRVASILMGSSETIFYTLTVYAGAARVRRVPGAVAASLMGYAAGVVLCGLMA